MTKPRTQHDYDFIIVGARCAGASTARLLAQEGARVLVLDRGRLGADTLSTSFLMRGAVQQLERWGILPALIAAGTPPVRETYFHYASRSVRVDIRPSAGFDALYAPRRTVLDPLLVAAAEVAGAEFQFGARVCGLLREDGRITGVELVHDHARRRAVTAGMVIGADGTNSSVAEWVGARSYRVGHHGSPAIYGYFENMPVEGYHWHYAHGMGAGAAPTNDGLRTVFVGAPPERLYELGGDRQAAMVRIASQISPSFGAALAEARRIGPLRAFPGLRGFYRTSVGPGWALVGDAGYFRDPITAHGISDALRDAELLARALLTADERALEDYVLARDRASERLFWASDAIAGGNWSELEVEQLLREASEGMREGVRTIEALPQAGGRMSSAAHARSSGVPVSRLATRTDSTSGLV